MPEHGEPQPVASTSVSVQAWFSNDDIVIDPGTTITLQLTVHNLGEATDSFTIVPSGLTANWLTVVRSNITLFGGSQDVVDIEVQPPLLPTTTAGPSVIGVRVIPTNEPDETVVAEATLDVQAFDDRRIVALQPVQRARRRSNFEFMVENHGNGLASCRLRLIDPTNRIDGSFDPPAVGVAPGGASLVRLKAKAKRGFFRRSTRTLDFDIEAEQQGHDPASSSLSFVQSPTIPASVLWRVAAILALLAAAAAAWFGLVKPEIDDAAQNAVDDRIAAVTPAADGTPVEQVPATSVVTPTVPAADDGEPEFIRLTVTPALTETVDASHTVPDDQLFDMTDVRVENRGNDTGLATLLINGEELYTWSLGNIRGSVFEPSLTQIRLQPGDNLTFSVRCDGVGDTTAGTCVNAVNIGGLGIEVDQI